MRYCQPLVTALTRCIIRLDPPHLWGKSKQIVTESQQICLWFVQNIKSGFEHIFPNCSHSGWLHFCALQYTTPLPFAINNRFVDFVSLFSLYKCISLLTAIEGEASGLYIYFLVIYPTKLSVGYPLYMLILRFFSDFFFNFLVSIWFCWPHSTRAMLFQRNAITKDPSATGKLILQVICHAAHYKVHLHFKIKVVGWGWA